MTRDYEIFFLIELLSTVMPKHSILDQHSILATMAEHENQGQRELIRKVLTHSVSGNDGNIDNTILSLNIATQCSGRNITLTPVSLAAKRPPSGYKETGSWSPPPFHLP